jgi:metallo-beta-lactamase family protein
VSQPGAGDQARLRLAFHGGAGTVTGSRYLITASGQTIEVDAGLFQGLKQLRLMNWSGPAFDPHAVDTMLLTHAHIDHIGYLPRLVRQGFRGPVFCTRPTAELAEILLLDAARLQEEDAEYANRKGFSKHRPALPLYTEDDVRDALRHLRPVDYGDGLDLGSGIHARFQDAGHILGSASIVLRAPAAEGDTTVVFSGDLGRYDMPLQTDPTPPPACDALVLESTYGDRNHDEKPLIEQVRGAFGRVIRGGGTILIPSFAVARVQLVALLLVDLMESGQLPHVPIHVDSPMAAEVTAVYARYRGSEYLDPELPRVTRHDGPPVRFHRTVAESRQLNELPGPRIIISSSGMLTGGRVLHHLRRLAPHPGNLIALVGYQAAGTRGRALEDGAKTVRMHGEDIPVRASVLSINGLSAHADSDELVQWVKSAESRPGRVFVTHGEPEAASALARRLRDELRLRVAVPALGDEFEL